MALSTGKGYRTFAITGQKVQLSSGSVPNLSSLLRNEHSTVAIQQKNRRNQDTFYQTPDDLRRAVQKYMSASASDITRLNDTQISNLSFQNRSLTSNGGFSSRSSSRAGSPAPSKNLELSIRVSTPDETSGKMPPTGRGRPNSPNISLIRGPKLSVFYFNDDFTFDEDSSHAQLAENMFNDLTISSSLDQTSTFTDDVDDKTPMNSSNSDGGYVSSELSDNTIYDSPKIDVKRIQEAQRELSDQNNNATAKIDTAQKNLNGKNPKVQTNDSLGINLYLTQPASQSNAHQGSDNGAQQYDNIQRTDSKLSDDVFTENTVDETMRFSELKVSEASSMASTLHNDDLESNISYDIRINDTMGIPMVSTLKRQDGHGKPINVSQLNDNTITQDDGMLPVTTNKETSQQSPRKPDIPENKNWSKERSSSFSGFTQLERLREHSNRSYRDLNRIQGEHSYVKRNDSFVKSIENVSPWKGSWTARNVTFDETANKRFNIESRRELQREAIIKQSSTHNQTDAGSGQGNYKQPRQPFQYNSLDPRRQNRNHEKEEVSYQKRISMPQKSNLARHLHNTSAPSGNVSNYAWKRYSSHSSLEPHFSAYNRSQEEGHTIQVSRRSNHGPTGNPIMYNKNENDPRQSKNDFCGEVHNYSQAVPKDYKYPTLPRNFGGNRDNQKIVQTKTEEQKKAQLQEFIDPRLAFGMPNQNPRIVRQYYAQFYDQNLNKPVNVQPPYNYQSGPFQVNHSHSQGLQQNHAQISQRQHQEQQNQFRRNISSSSNINISSSAYPKPTSSSPIRNADSPSYSKSNAQITEANTSKSRSARRKLQLTEFEGVEQGSSKQYQKKKIGRPKTKTKK